MAAIEKICEYSGGCAGLEMYKFKNNQLQIMPKWRELFRGAEHTLYITIDTLLYRSKGNNHSYSLHSFRDFSIPVIRYEYKLKVHDKYLQGTVNGEYINYTTHLPTMRRKLKRLLRARKLNIVY